ncbi:MAG TPA: hypothetical protein DEB05_04330 [Firmicutes bacterium]|jgi:hypothetical protein|nr:hypothetical protein [Bacillota bacterium]HBT16168.1 hypothetical protein [Bacillota bacterium]
MKLNKRETRLLCLALLLIVGVLLFKWVIRPLNNRLQKVNTELLIIEQEIAKDRLLLQGSNHYLEALAGLKTTKAQIEPFIYQGEGNQVQLEILSFLDSLLKTCNLVVRNKDFKVEKLTNRKLSRSVAKLTLVGEMENLLLFLEELEKSDKFLIVKELNLSRAGAGEGLSISIKILALLSDPSVAG